MLPTPPPHSRIQVRTDLSSCPLLTLPKAKTGLLHYGIAAFLIVWLCGWAAGWLSAAREITTAGRAGASGGAFLIFWFAGWTIAGGFAIMCLWKILRPSVPETLILMKPRLIYDSGVQPLPVMWGYGRQTDFWKKMFAKRRRFEFSLAEMATIKLRDTEGDNRLTVDHGPDRVDIGKTLTEVEREWLFTLLREEYKV